MAVAVVALIKEGGMDREQVAAVCHRPIAWVTEQEEILSWPTDAQKAVHDGWLSVSAASNIALIHDDAHRALLLARVKEKGITSRTTASWLQAWRSTISCPETKQAEPDLV